MKKEIAAPYWNKRPVVLVAGGSSLSGFDFGRLAELDAWLVGINESIFYAPRCDCGVSVDRRFVEKRFDRLQEKIAGGMEMVAACGDGHRCDGMTVLTRRLTNRLSDRPTEIITCGTSGYGALNIAYLKRARRILLLGFDYSHDGAHYYPDYEWHRPPKRADCWHFWAKFYSSTKAQLDAAKVEVFNASPGSTITAFPRGTIDQGLTWVGNGNVHGCSAA